MSIFFYHTSLAILPLFFVLSFARFGANKLAIALSIMLGILCGFICFNAFFSIANIDNAKMFFEIFNIILLLLLPLTNIFKREYFTLWLSFLLSLSYAFTYRVISMDFAIFSGDLLDSFSLSNLFMVCFGFVLSGFVFLLMRSLLKNLAKPVKIIIYALTLILLIAQSLGAFLLSLMQEGIIQTYTTLLSFSAKLIYMSEFLGLALVLLCVLCALISLKAMPALKNYSDIIAYRQSKATRYKMLRECAFSVILAGVISAIVLFYLLIASKPPKISEPIIVEPQNGAFIFDAKSLMDNDLHRYAYITDSGRKIRFLLLNRFKDKLAPVAVYDACAICGDMGYIKKGDDLICISCNVRIFLPSVGKPGGCNPIPLDYSFDGQNIRINLDELEKGANFFSEVVEKMVLDPVSRELISNNSNFNYLYYGRVYYFKNAQNQANFEANASKFVEINGTLKDLK